MSALLDEVLRLKIEAAGAAPENSDVLAALLRSRLDVREDGTVTVLDAAGNVRVGGGPTYGDMSLDEAVSELAAAKPGLFCRSAPAAAEAPPARQEPPPDETMTARAIREARERREADATARAKQPEVNPWANGSINITNQVRIAARDPERAARMRAEAAAVPTYPVDKR